MNPKSRRDQQLLHSPGTGENLNLTQSNARDSPASVGTARVMSSTCSCSSIQSTPPAAAAPISSCTLYLSSPEARLLIAPSCPCTAAFNPFLSPGPAPLPPRLLSSSAPCLLTPGQAPVSADKAHSEASSWHFGKGWFTQPSPGSLQSLSERSRVNYLCWEQHLINGLDQLFFSPAALAQSGHKLSHLSPALCHPHHKHWPGLGGQVLLLLSTRTDPPVFKY